MQMSNRILCALACVWLCATLDPRVGHCEITVQSQPSHVHVEFRGPLTIAGVAPLSLERLPPGDYLVRATGLGLVTARGRVRSTFDNHVTAQRWAQPYAFLMPPGLVHMSRRDGWRGSMFTAAAIGGTIGAIAKNAHHDDAVNNFELAQEAYNRAVSEEEIKAASLDLENASDRVDDEEFMRNAWIGYTAVTWAGAALEAWLLTSPPKVRPLGSGSFEVGVSRARPIDAAFRSILVPGAGQRHMGHTWRSIVFGLSVYTLSAFTISSYDEYLNAKRKQSDAQRRYKEATTPADIEVLRANLDTAADAASDWRVTVWSLGGAAAAAYIWNVLDALGQGSTGWEPSGVEVGLAPRFDGVMASITWRMP